MLYGINQLSCYNSYNHIYEGSAAMILVSSCLAGKACRYDATSCLHAKIGQLAEENNVVMVCPEVMGGLHTPRDPAEIVGGTGADVLTGKAKVITVNGVDVTEQFLRGAQQTLKIAKQHNATLIILKQNSPSCGSKAIYDGSFTGAKIAGEGVTAALLRQNGFTVISEDDEESGSVPFNTV